MPGRGPVPGQLYKMRHSTSALAEIVGCSRNMHFTASWGGGSHGWEKDASVGDHSRAAVDQLCLLVPLERIRGLAEPRGIEAEVTGEAAVLSSRQDMPRR